MVEGCVEAVRGSRASFVVDGDPFGFNRMLRGYSFIALHWPPGGNPLRRGPPHPPRPAWRTRRRRPMDRAVAEPAADWFKGQVIAVDGGFDLVA
jgi:hypothetical protein